MVENIDDLINHEFGHKITAVDEAAIDEMAGVFDDFTPNQIEIIRTRFSENTIEKPEELLADIYTAFQKSENSNDFTIDFIIPAGNDEFDDLIDLFNGYSLIELQ